MAVGCYHCPMDAAWFIYTLTLMVLTVAACVTSVTVWVLTERRDCLVAAAGFLAYTLDTGLIFFDEYLRTKPLGAQYLEVGLTHPVPQVLLCAALVSCAWVWVLLRVRVMPDTRRVVGVTLAAVVLLWLVAPKGAQAGMIRTMAYWGLRDVCVLLALAYAAWRYHRRATEIERLDMDRHLRVYVVCCVLAVSVLVEDAANILFLRPDLSSGLMRDFLWHLTERNLSENLLMVCCAVCSMRYDRGVMQVFARHPAKSEEVLEAAQVKSDFESRLLAFADARGITKREREVLELALKGKDTQNIASELFISTGTVKAHLHRIYKKAEVATRDELVAAFWRG